ncbi:hypothetical protein ACWDRR_39515 [Kitasatospora sp. NPDC003701]
MAGLEFWERTIPFPSGGTPAAPPPDFSLRTGPVSEDPVSPTIQAVPLGSIYQVRALNRGSGSARLAENPDPQRTIGALDFPSITRGPRRTHLTACGNKPRVVVTPGGTFVSIAFATQSLTMARVQLLDSSPEMAGPGGTADPYFFAPNVIASAVSTSPALVHRLSLVDQISSTSTGHIPLRTNQVVWFNVLAWDDQGNYDVVWNTTGLAPATPPETIRTKQRVVRARLARLYCHDDSDQLGSGSGAFTFAMTGGSSAVTSDPVSWNPMSTGDMLEVPAGTTDLVISPPDAATTVRVRVDGVEDDSGSFPSDSDDKASTADGKGPALPFPIGRGKEVVTDTVITLKSLPTTLSGDELSFSADIVYDIDYT